MPEFQKHETPQNNPPSEFVPLGRTSSSQVQTSLRPDSLWLSEHERASLLGAKGIATSNKGHYY